MAKYRILMPVKTDEGVIHGTNEIVELTEQEAKNCLSFCAVELVEEPQQGPVQDPQEVPQDSQTIPNGGEGQ